MERPFVDFYRQHGTAPVAQDITDLRKHFDRRDALFRQLGLVPALLRNKKVIEFGPGTGHNSVFTASLRPERYVLVDGNPTSIVSVKNMLADYSNECAVEVVESYIEDFSRPEQFDVVFCEGTIPTQRDPSQFARHVGDFTEPGGVLVITCMDGISMVSEILRRIASSLVMQPRQTLDEQVELLLPIFAPHLATLKGMSRLPRDWIIDSLIHPWVGPLFSIPEAILTLSDGFEFYGCSPQYVQDWRWYKDIWGSHKQHNERGIEQYWSSAHNLIDCRYLHSARSVDSNRALAELCDQLYKLHSVTPPDRESWLGEVIILGRAIAKETREFSTESAQALEDCCAAFEQFLVHGQLPKFGRFESLWGRGQQYLSFIKRG